MKKIILILFLLVILIGLSVYFTVAYTYFLEKKVGEKLPSIPLSGEQKVVAQLKILKDGSFTDADFFPKGNGRAFILEYPDKKNSSLRFF